MRNRIVGGIALLFGLATLTLMLTSDNPIELQPFFGSLLFIGMGGFYLFSGKKAVRISEFIIDGKLSSDSSLDSIAKKATEAPDMSERREALRLLAKSKGLSEKQMDIIELTTHAELSKKMEEIFDKIAKEQGLTELERKDFEATYREKLVAMHPSKNH